MMHQTKSLQQQQQGEQQQQQQQHQPNELLLDHLFVEDTMANKQTPQNDPTVMGMCATTNNNIINNNKYDANNEYDKIKPSVVEASITDKNHNKVIHDSDAGANFDVTQCDFDKYVHPRNNYGGRVYFCATRKKRRGPGCCLSSQLRTYDYSSATTNITKGGIDDKKHTEYKRDEFDFTSEPTKTAPRIRLGRKIRRSQKDQKNVRSAKPYNNGTLSIKCVTTIRGHQGSPPIDSQCNKRVTFADEAIAHKLKQLNAQPTLCRKRRKRTQK